MSKKARLTPKQRVLKRYPEAFSWWYCADVCKVDTGLLHPCTIGMGGSVRHAWEDAAEFIKRYGG